MKGILLSAVREFKLMFRDGITVYLAISPALLALLFIFVFGRAQTASVSFVVDRNFPQELTDKLEAVADIEYADDFESLKKRVSGADSIAGVYWKDGDIRLLVEGNEAQGFAQSRRLLISTALGTGTMEYTSEAVEGRNSAVYDISMACIFLMALFIGGCALGLGGVNERECGVIRAVSVSPMTLPGYAVSKIIPAMLFGIVGVSLSSLIIGRADALPRFILLALCSVFVTGMILFLIITFADNQITAVGALKIIMPIFLVVGVSAAFVPEKWLVLYYVLPMYWQYAAIDAILAGRMPVLPLLMILATGIPWFIAVMLLFVGKIKMKTWR